MPTVESLSRQLERYKRLKFHHSRRVALTLVQVQRWQIERMKTMHQELFNHPDNRKIADFLINRLYNVKDMRILAQQLHKALNEQIKLEKFLPESVMEAAELGFQLAFVTINLDEQIAIYCLRNGHTEITEEVMRVASLELDHTMPRYKQLILLIKLSRALHQFSKSLLLQSAFKLAKRIAYRRGFSPLYDYLEEGFRAVKSTPSAQQFFLEFTAREKILLQRVRNGHPTPFQAMLTNKAVSI